MTKLKYNTLNNVPYIHFLKFNHMTFLLYDESVFLIKYSYIAEF